MSKIMAMLPAYNEEKHLPAVLEKLKPLIETIVVVDDGSTDRTKAVAEAAGVTVLSRGYNMGVGQTTMDGLAWALDHDFEAVIMLDSDGQHDPLEVPLFVQKYEETQARMIIGERDYSQMPLIRRFSNTIGRWMLSSAVGEYLPDNQSGYRLVHRDLIKKLLNSKESGYHFMVDMIIICLASGWKIGWVPIATIYGDERSYQKVWYQIYGFTRMCLDARRKMKSARATLRTD